MEKLEVFKSPTKHQEAYDKWKIATRMLKSLVAVGLITEEKLKQAEEIASWE